MAIEKQHYGGQHGEVGYTLHFLAKAYYQTKNYSEAFQYSQQAKQILENAKGFGENHPWTRIAVKFADFDFLKHEKKRKRDDLDDIQQTVSQPETERSIPSSLAQTRYSFYRRSLGQTENQQNRDETQYKPDNSCMLM